MRIPELPRISPIDGELLSAAQRFIQSSSNKGGVISN